MHDLNKLDFEKEDAQVIVYGHSHISKISKEKDKLLINPGECCGWITGQSSVVLLDLSNLSVQTVVL